VDEGVEISNYNDVARLLTTNVDPERDIVLGTGPMDVLDHSCSAFAFGGKMGIDATQKFPEELRSGESIENKIDSSLIDVEAIKAKFPAIDKVYAGLIDKGISMVFISFEKNETKQVKKMAQTIFETGGLNQVKMILFVDDKIDVTDVADVVWRVSNNSDAKRDSFIIEADNDTQISHIAMDGSRKTKEFDNFQRDWPNIITSDDKTIKSIDEKWSSLGLGEFISSPSLKYKKYQYSEGAIVVEAEKSV